MLTQVIVKMTVKAVVNRKISSLHTEWLCIFEIICSAAFKEEYSSKFKQGGQSLCISSIYNLMCCNIAEVKLFCFKGNKKTSQHFRHCLRLSQPLEGYADQAYGNDKRSTLPKVKVHMCFNLGHTGLITIKRVDITNYRI